MTLEGLLMAEDRSGIMGLLRGVAERGVPHTETEYPLHEPDGRVTWWQVAALPLPLPEAQGSEPDLMLLMMDVTDLTQARKQLEALAARLEQMNRAKDDFMAMLGHELRNPLAPILNSLYVMRLRGPVGENQARMMEIIERQVQQMARLVDDLLDVSRITRGKIELRKQAGGVGACGGARAGELSGAVQNSGTRAEHPDARGSDPAGGGSGAAGAGAGQPAQQRGQVH